MVLDEGPFLLPDSEWAEDFNPSDWSGYLPQDGDFVQHRGRRILFQILRDADGAFVAWARHIVDGLSIPEAQELAALGRQAIAYYLAETWADETEMTRRRAIVIQPARTFQVTVARDADGEQPAYIEISETTPLH